MSPIRESCSYERLYNQGSIVGHLEVGNIFLHTLLDFTGGWVDMDVCLNRHDFIGAELLDPFHELLQGINLGRRRVEANKDDVDLVLDEKLCNVIQI